jgi:hypothetical protein
MLVAIFILLFIVFFPLLSLFLGIGITAVIINYWWVIVLFIGISLLLRYGRKVNEKEAIKQKIISQKSVVENRNSNEKLLKKFSLEEKSISNDAFKLFLIDNFKITKNDLLNQFVMNEKLFDSLDEVLISAKLQYENQLEVEEQRLKHQALQKDKQDAERNRIFHEQKNLKDKKQKKIIILALMVALILMFVGYFYDNWRSQEADKAAQSVGFANSEEMHLRGFISPDDFIRAKEITAAYFSQVCHWQGRELYKRRCLGRKVIWEGRILGVTSYDGVHVQLIENGHKTFNGKELATIDSKSLAAQGINETHIGKKIKFVGIIGNENILYPDVERIAWFEIGGSFSPNVESVSKDD